MTYSSPDPLDELAAALARIAAHLDAAADALRAEHRAGVEAVAAAFDPTTPTPEAGRPAAARPSAGASHDGEPRALSAG